MNELDSKKIKETELEILDYFVAFCQKHNLKYYLTYGSLLGAVRHKGIIPWDDDIDIVLMPDEYDKLINVLTESNDERYKWWSPCRFRTCYSRIYDCSSSFKI